MINHNNISQCALDFPQEGHPPHSTISFPLYKSTSHNLICYMSWTPGFKGLPLPSYFLLPPPPQSFPPQISVPPGFNSGTHFRQPSPIPQSFNLPSMDLKVHLCFCQIIVPIFPLGIVHNSSLVRMRQNSVAMLPQRPNTPTSTFLTAIPWVSFWTIVVTVPVLHWAKREISWPTVQLVVDCLKSLSALLVLKVGLTARYWSKPLKTKFHTEKAFLSLSIVPT